MRWDHIKAFVVREGLICNQENNLATLFQRASKKIFKEVPSFLL